MKRWLVVFTALLASSFGAREAAAQGIFLGAGATIPTGDFADFGAGDGANTGVMAFGGVLSPLGTAGLSIGAEGFFGMNGHDTEGDKTNLYGALGLLGYTFGDPETASPFVFGGLGFMTHSYKSDDFPEFEGSESGAAVSFGGGLNFPLGGVGGMIAGSYNMGLGDIDETTFVAISAAVQIPLG